MAETTTLKSRIKHAYKTEVEWSNSTVPLLEGEVAYSSDKGNMYKVGDGTSKWSALSYNKSDTANTATKLATARTIQTNLASTSTASFDGSANVTPGVTGVLPVANGGTGNSSVDTTPTSESTKMVTSGGVYTALSEKQDLIPAWADSMGTNSITLNHKNAASGDYACAEGYCTYALGQYSHAEGYYTTAFGISSHSEGGSTGAVVTQMGSLGTDTTNSDIITTWDNKKFSLAKGNSSHVEGMDCLALGDYSHAEGRYTTASASGSHAEGYYTNASVYYSHAEGHYTTASAFGSHAEGYYTTASGEYSHAEGRYTTASASGSHAEGFDTTASGIDSHAEGYYTTASGIDSHAEGYYTTASGRNQHVQGKYNIEDTSSTYAHIVGNGTADDARSNAYTLDWDGNGWYAGGLTVTSDLSVKTTIKPNVISWYTPSNEKYDEIQLRLSGSTGTQGISFVAYKNGSTIGFYNIISSDGSTVLPGDLSVSGKIKNEMTNDSGWKNATLGSDFSLYSSGTNVQYRKIGKVVHVRGQVKPKRDIAGSSTVYTIFTLPSGYRPSANEYFVCQGSTKSTWLCTVGTNGNVTFSRYGTNSFATCTTSHWLPFNFSFTIN